MVNTYVVISAAYRVVEASSPLAAVEMDAVENPRRGVGRDIVVVTTNEAEALLRRLVHVQVSPGQLKKRAASDE